MKCSVWGDWKDLDDRFFFGVWKVNTAAFSNVGIR